jgi:aryl-alcohol dehydrogenase-like predicted oxidoreductase
MIYRFLGRTGLKVSALGFGNWVTGHDTKEE